MRRTCLLVALLALGLAGCASNEDVVRDCCYQGPSSGARLQAVMLKLEDGRLVPFMNVFKGFRPDAVFGPLYPVPEADLRFVVQPDLRAIFASYDANDDGVLERPEITVMYVVEAARGLGVPVQALGKPRTGALDVAPADIAGLVEFVSAHRAQMTRRARRVFAEMTDLGYDWPLISGRDGSHFDRGGSGHDSGAGHP